MVTGAIEECELLSSGWSTIATNLGQMATEAESAKKKTAEVMESTYFYIKNHLIAMKNAWDEVSAILYMGTD